MGAETSLGAYEEDGAGVERVKFSIVIPAYNEEQAIGEILRRCAGAAVRIIQAGAGIDSIEIIVVNDGSSDRTEELARAEILTQINAEIQVFSHPGNRGYGAALKTGFDMATGEILGFLDADGTCDPNFFVDLLKVLAHKKFDIVVGSRLHPGSRMPFVRTAGNRIFRSLVNCFGESPVSDVASGMRVFRREALERLYPLPDGLNFTPAMTVRAVLDPDLAFGEIPMPYEERIGRSKLSVVKDGFRFLGAILDTAVTYRPLFFFGTAAILLGVLSAIALCFPLGGPSAPLFYYFENRQVEDWTIFRIVLVTVWLALAAFLAALGVVAQAMTSVINREIERSRRTWWITTAISRRFAWLGAASLALSVYINRRPLFSYWKTGHIPTEYWMFPVVGSLFALIGAEFIAFGLMSRIARLLRERQKL